MIHTESWYKEALFEEEKRRFKSLLQQLQEYWDEEMEVNQEILQQIKHLAARLGIPVPVYFEMDQGAVQDKFHDWLMDYAVGTWDSLGLQFDWERDEGFTYDNIQTKYGDWENPIATADGEVEIRMEMEVNAYVDVTEYMSDPDPGVIEEEDYDSYEEYEDALTEAVDEAREQAVSAVENVADNEFLQSLNNFPAEVSNARVMHTETDWDAFLNEERARFWQNGRMDVTFLDPMEVDITDATDLIIDPDMESNWK